MKIKNKRLFRISIISILLLLTLWFIKDFNLYWVEVSANDAKITINFLFPMDQQKFPEHISISPQLPYATEFDYTLEWLTKSVVCIKLKEQHPIKGQKIQLKINNAPSQFSYLKRTTQITIPFITDVALLSPLDQLLIATDKSFIIRFNTPMNKNKLHQFLQSDAKFYIEPVKILNPSGQELEDLSTYKFTPKVNLDNGKRYILSFRKGMPSQNGALLQQDLSIVLKTDVKPIIALTYPQNNSKWIGLYPRFKIETDSPTVAGYLTLGKETIQGKNLDPYHIEFLLPQVLKSDTLYQADFQVESSSGERSQLYTIKFTTVRIDTDRLWMDIVSSPQITIHIYKGDQILKKIKPLMLNKSKKLPLGTYYIYEKGTSYIDARYQEGANFWLKVTDSCMIQGQARDTSWKLKNTTQTDHIILSDMDAHWLYQTIPQDTMVIIR